MEQLDKRNPMTCHNPTKTPSDFCSDQNLHSTIMIFETRLFHPISIKWVDGDPAGSSCLAFISTFSFCSRECGRHGFISRVSSISSDAYCVSSEGPLCRSWAAAVLPIL
jgi:hypothetical protein